MLLCIYGQSFQANTIRFQVGTTSRGLSLRQLRDGLHSFGFESNVIAFDKSRSEYFPCPGVILLERGHYIVLSKRTGDLFEVFNPESGWQKHHVKWLARQANGLCIEVGNFTPPAFLSVLRLVSPIFAEAIKQIKSMLGHGYLDFGRLFTIHQAQAFFVTLAKHNTQFKRGYSQPVAASRSRHHPRRIHCALGPARHADDFLFEQGLFVHTALCKGSA